MINPVSCARVGELVRESGHGKRSMVMTKLSVCLPITLIIAGYLGVGASVQAMPVLPSTKLLSTADTGILHVRARTTTKKTTPKNCGNVHGGVGSVYVNTCPGT